MLEVSWNRGGITSRYQEIYLKNLGPGNACRAGTPLYAYQTEVNTSDKGPAIELSFWQPVTARTCASNSPREQEAVVGQEEHYPAK